MIPYGVTQFGATPGPEATVEIHPLSESAPGLAVIAIVDTGAVQTCMPLQVVCSLDEQERAIRKPIGVRGALGDIVEAEAVLLRVVVGRINLGRRWVIVISKSYGLLGRDVLNECHVILDGPNRRWTIDRTS